MELFPTPTELEEPQHLSKLRLLDSLELYDTVLESLIAIFCLVILVTHKGQFKESFSSCTPHLQSPSLHPLCQIYLWLVYDTPGSHPLATISSRCIRVRRVAARRIESRKQHVHDELCRRHTLLRSDMPRAHSLYFHDNRITSQIEEPRRDFFVERRT